MRELRLEFHPTGQGYVLCKRFYFDGKEARSIAYELGCQTPMLLMPAHKAEFELAMEMEQAEAEYTGRKALGLAEKE